MSFTRTARSRVLPFLRDQLEKHEVTVEDYTNRVARITLMEPDAGKLFSALEFEESDRMAVGDHQLIDVIQEPVRVCRSDFAGPLGYDLVTDREPFHMFLAVLCAWAVRLELLLLPVGYEAVQKVRQKQ